MLIFSPYFPYFEVFLAVFASPMAPKPGGADLERVIEGNLWPFPPPKYLFLPNPSNFRFLFR